MQYEIPEIKVSVSFKRNQEKNLLKISSTKTAYQAFLDVFNGDTINWCEEFLMLCLNNANEVTGFYKVSSGGTTGTVVDNKIIFTIALNACATSILIAHNHPSGRLYPSEADKQVTKKIKNACELLQITLLDHLIVTESGYYSFNEEGTL